MQDWKFKISGKILIPGMENQTLNIYPENIKSLVRVSDYIGRNTPMMMARLNLDKNFFDLIVKNAKDATLYLKIDKFNNNEELTTKTTLKYIEEEFSIFLSSDINYSKDLDYMKAGDNSKNAFNPNDVAKDKYREVIIGLMSKQCIDSNKVVANNVFRDTTMMAMACSYMTQLHLLIEPFDYNKSKEQFVVPPKDTLSKTIEYLNSVEVFYSTQYLFFIDEPYCTYLISRSGKGIQRKDEKYKDVFIDMRKSTDSSMACPGMEEDDKNKRYSVIVPSVRSKYTINHDSAKIYSEMKAVINPNQENTINKNDDILKVQKYINQTTGTFREYVHSYAKNVGNVAENISTLKSGFTADVKDRVEPYTKKIDEIQSVALNDELKSVPTSVGVTEGDSSFSISLVSAGFTSSVLSSVNSGMSSSYSNIGDLKGMDNKFSKLSDYMIPAYYDAMYMDNYLGSVTHINAQDVISKTTKMSSSIGKKSDNINTDYNTQISGQVSTITNTSSSVSGVANQMQNTKTTIEAIQAGSKYGLVASQHSGQNETLNKVKDNADKVNRWSKQVNSACTSLKDAVTSCGKIVSSYSGFANNVAKFTNSLNSIVNVNVKSKFCSIGNATGALGNVTKGLNTITNAVQAFSNISNILNSGTLDMKALQQISQNLNKVKDIKSIGKTGIPAINIALQLGNLSNTFKAGTKLFKTKNDNPNQLKNIKSEVESMINQVTFTKPGLDPSVFTPNKRYTIKNYDGHSDKDGIFILNKKVETYMREGDCFICTLSLSFSKIIEESNSNQAENNAKKESPSSSNNNKTTNTTTSAEVKSAYEALKQQKIILT